MHIQNGSARRSWDVMSIMQQGNDEPLPLFTAGYIWIYSGKVCVMTSHPEIISESVYKHGDANPMYLLTLYRNLIISLAE